MQYIMLTCPPREAIFKATIAECPVKPIVVVDDAMAGAFDGFMRCLKLADGEPFVFLEDDLHFTSDFDAKWRKPSSRPPIISFNYSLSRKA